MSCQSHVYITGREAPSIRAPTAVPHLILTWFMKWLLTSLFPICRPWEKLNSSKLATSAYFLLFSLPFSFLFPFLFLHTFSGGNEIGSRGIQKILMTPLHHNELNEAERRQEIEKRLNRQLTKKDNDANDYSGSCKYALKLVQFWRPCRFKLRVIRTVFSNLLRVWIN